MYRRLLGVICVLVIMLMSVSGCSTQKKPTPKSTATPKPVAYKTLNEAAGADPYRNGCVSCHKKEGNVDRSLPAYVKRIEGHPEVKETTVNACYVCHEAQKNYDWYKKFFRGIHKAHWGSDTFYSKLKGQCYSCHTVETNGVSGIKEYPLAGYRTGVTISKTAPVKEPAEVKTESVTPEKTKPETTTKSKQSPSKPETKQEGEVEIPTPTP